MCVYHLCGIRSCPFGSLNICHKDHTIPTKLQFVKYSSNDFSKLKTKTFFPKIKYLIITACQAIGNVTTSSSVIYNGPIYQALLSSNGLYYPGTERGYAYINMTLSEKSTNIVGLSFTLHQASNVMVTLLDNKQSVIKKVSIVIN